MSNLYSLRDSKRRLSQLECIDNAIHVKNELIYVHDAHVADIENKVHERDRLGAINGGNLSNTNERRKFNYIIVNVSKKTAIGADDLVVCRNNAFELIKDNDIKESDTVVGQFVTEIRLESLMTFNRFS